MYGNCSPGPGRGRAVPHAHPATKNIKFLVCDPLFTMSYLIAVWPVLIAVWPVLIAV